MIDHFHAHPAAQVAAVGIEAMAATGDGTLVAVGPRCRGSIAAEIWEPNKTKSRIVDLKAMTDNIASLDRTGPTDENQLWARGGAFEDTLTFAHGEFTRDRRPSRRS